MQSNKKFFGLDIGTNAIRLVQLDSKASQTGLKNLVKYAHTPVDSKIIASDSKADRDQLSGIIKNLITQANLNTKNVAVGMPSSKVFTAIVDVDKLKQSEMKKSIEFQADAFIPTPLESSIIDWTIIGDSPKDVTKSELLISSTTTDYATSRLELIEAAGLNVIAFEPDVLAISRALIQSQSNEVILIVDIGTRYTDIIVLINNNLRLSRSIPIGSESLVKSVAQNLNSELNQAEQFLFKFGLSQDKLEGQIYQSVINTIENLMSEVDKSIKFFYSRYQNIKITKVIVSGAGAILPEFPLFVANYLKVAVEIGNAWLNVGFDMTLRPDLMAISNQFTVAVGLAERNE